MTARMDPGHRWQNCRVHADEDRERLRQTFDAAAARYDRVRPEYPGALFDDLVALAGLTPGDHLLEEYIELLETFSGHLDMAEWKRRRLYGEIRRRLALRPGHTVRRGWGAVLHVARRLG
jgi:hypothetical protein